MVKYEEKSDTLTEIFQALADPTRRAILAHLAVGKATVNELAEPFAISLPAITKHLKVLEKAGLVKRERNAQYRPAKLNAEPLRQASDWIEQYRKNWEESLGRLENYLQKLQQEKQ